MPTVHREHGFQFVIYSDDHPPPHVHVTGRDAGKIALEPTVALVHGRGLSKADVRRVLGVVEDRRDRMIEAWKRIHG